MSRCVRRILAVCGLLCYILSLSVEGLKIKTGPISKSSTGIEYKTQYIRQKVDHFGWANDDTYRQRYLIADQYWNKNGGPIFFYTGNEGAIDWFCNNTGLMWEWAPEFQAMLVFAEHRYYGESLPYGKSSFEDPQHMGYLTAEQALADFVTLLDYLKSTMVGASDSPVVAFGGSYGGMLASWMRMKYPHAVVGALAASAPIWQFGQLVPCGIFNQIVTRDFQEASPSCSKNIRKSWVSLDNLGKTETGRQFMSDTLGLCKPLQSSNATQAVKDWLTDMWGSLAMVDYPYSASFLEPLPAWPVKAVCATKLSQSDLGDRELVEALKEAADVYFNYTGSATCYDVAERGTSDLGGPGWNIQTCTEMVMPMCSDGVADMFEPSPWDLGQFIKYCQDTYKLTPRPKWIMEQFGGKDIASHSNIIFSNGRLDPWSGGGVMKTISDSIVAIVIEEGAHHLDLRGSHEDDPESVINARQQEKAIISEWIEKFYEGETRLYDREEKSPHVMISHLQALPLWLVALGVCLAVCALIAATLLLRGSPRHTRKPAADDKHSQCGQFYRPL